MDNNDAKRPLANISDANVDSSEPTEEYWKQLASERSKALNDTLEENEDISQLIQSRDTDIMDLSAENTTLREENTILEKKAARIDTLTDLLTEMLTE